MVLPAVLQDNTFIGWREAAQGSRFILLASIVPELDRPAFNHWFFALKENSWSRVFAALQRVGLGAHP